MLANQAGALIKGHRVRMGLKQSDLARAAGVSRTILSRLENGGDHPVQTDILDRIFRALDVYPRVVHKSEPDPARKQARLDHQSKLDQQRSRHLRLAIALSSDAKSAPAMISKARARVELWRSKASCSPFYIERWSALLKLPPRKIAQAMASFGDWEDAMFQNSPWTWAWN